jgi:hypothetical protein
MRSSQEDPDEAKKIHRITSASDVKRILEHVGEASEPPVVSPSRAPPEEAFEFSQDPPREEEFDFDQRTGWDDDTGGVIPKCTRE